MAGTSVGAVEIKETRFEIETVAFSDRCGVGSNRETSIMTPMSPIKATRWIVVPFTEIKR